MKRALIIKLGALGDFVQATPAFYALQKAFPDIQFDLLTTDPFVSFAQRLEIFTNIIVDVRPKFYEIHKFIKLRRCILKKDYEYIIDLQSVDRTRFYKNIIRGNATWFDIPKAHNHQHPRLKLKQLLCQMGIEELPPLDLKSLATPYPTALPTPYILCIPDASNAHQGAKKWPETHYIELIQMLQKQGFHVILIGGSSNSCPQLQQLPDIINLMEKTDFFQIIGLAQNATISIGNDTGPMLLAASSDCPTLTFFSKHNPPNHGGARGERNISLYADEIGNITPGEAMEVVQSFLRSV